MLGNLQHFKMEILFGIIEFFEQCKISTRCTREPFEGKQARKPRSYASSKLSPAHLGKGSKTPVTEIFR